ncbi:MAG: hypothetical protein LBP98_07540 [Tannerella sp.]|jgi:hypothetical protein|nr:hypothetical protein [Tannerella sp.]
MMNNKYGLTEEEIAIRRKEILEYDSIKSAIAYSKERGIEEGIEKARREIIKQCLEGGIPIETVSSIARTGREEPKNISNSQEHTQTH